MCIYVYRNSSGVYRADDKYASIYVARNIMHIQ
jgi:hypothetical protein